MNRAQVVSLLATTAGILLFGLFGPFVPPASPEAPYEATGWPLSGQRYQTMLSLARYLDVTAQGVLEDAVDAARGKSSEARFLASIRSFAGVTDDFRRRMDGYLATPFEIAPRVRDLTQRAGRVNDQIRAAQALESTYQEWEGIIDVLQRMTLLLAGRNVDVPVPYVVPALSGLRLDEVRRLARDLHQSATQAREEAKRDLRDYPGRGPQFLAELQYFVARSQDVLAQVEAAAVDPQQVGPVVDRLLVEARRADRSRRDAQVFREVWDESGRTISILGRLTGLLRSVERRPEEAAASRVKEGGNE